MTSQLEDIKSKTNQNENDDNYMKLPADIGTDLNFKQRIVWKNALGFFILHLGAIYGLYLFFYCKLLTQIWSFVVAFTSGFGVTIGAHRFYTHRTFKAKWPVRLMLTVLQTVAGQNCMWVWVRDHRQHHKYSDSDADPHNANRGFFFAHIGWLIYKKHPLVISKGKGIDMSDLEADRFVMLQKKYYKTFYVIFALLTPIAVPVCLWNETALNAFFIVFLFRTILVLNFTWMVNSWAHFFGTKPFDTRLKPVESTLVSFIGLGEGWHNYHHAFPWDYRAAEFGSKYSLSTTVIDKLANYGWVYDLKTTNFHMIQQRGLKFGDGSHKIFSKEAQQKYQKNIEKQKSFQTLRPISVRG